jgi:4-amino-4-deoxy-L-arabinose transferase-like glycosyltransferase
LVSLVGAKSWTAHRIATCFLGAATVGVTGLLGRRIAGPVVGLVAATIAALDPMLFQSDAALLAESLFALLVVLALLVAYRAADNGGWRWWALLGATVGLAALTRGEGLLLLVLLAIPLAGRHWRMSLTAVAVAVLVLTPWTVRNALTFHRFVLVSNNTGTLLAGANCGPVYGGEKIGLWLFKCVPTAPDKNADEAQIAAFYRSTGIDYARAHAGDLPRVASVRWLRTMGVYEPTLQAHFEAQEGRSVGTERVGTVIWWVLAPLGVLGGVVLWRRRQRVWPLAVPLVISSATAIVTYGNQRFRESVQPVAAVLAGVLIVSVVGSVRRPRRPPA